MQENPPHPSPLDKDKKIKIMDELIKTNQKHIEHLKQTINQLKKQLQFEQKRNQDFEKDNTLLKEQIKKLLQKPILHTQSTQTTLEGARLKQIPAGKDDIYPNNSATKPKVEAPLLPPRSSEQVVTSPQKEIKRKLDVKIDINQALKRQQSGPISSVIKSSTYLHGLTDAKLIDAIKERIPEKTYRNGMYSSDKMSKNKTLIFNFQNKSTIFDNNHEEIEIQQRNSEGKQMIFESIIEEQRADTMEVSALQPPVYKLFEKFYIMGCEKKEFLEFDNDPSIKEGILPSSILFKNDQTTPIYESIINGFVYPFGNRVEKIKVNDSFRKLKEIMYSGNKYELLDKFSLFTIKNQDDSQEIEAVNQVLLNQSNPEKLLYGICLSVYDYIETTPDNIELTYKNRKKRIFWKYKKTYCFLTYFPFYELFQDLLISIINLIKINRTDRYLKKYSEEYEVLKDVDGQQIILEFQSELLTFLKLINDVKPQQGHQLLEIQTLAGTLKYKLPNQLQLDVELRLWSANVTLQVLNYREILTIFLSIMSEISVIFICEKSNILTSVIHFFHHLIRPAEWTHPIIYNVPEQLLTMIQSPVPIIIGVNLSEPEFHLSGLANDSENCLFVFLDREKESKIVPKPLNLLLEISTPYFNGTLMQIEQLMKCQNNIRNPSPGLRQNKPDDKKTIKFYFDDADQNKSKKVLELFKKIIHDYIIALLPPLDEEGVKNSTDVNIMLIERIIVSKSEPRDKKFIENICRTQYFQFFLQEFYNQS